jgi:hypothetical protein
VIHKVRFDILLCNPWDGLRFNCAGVISRRLLLDFHEVIVPNERKVVAVQISSSEPEVPRDGQSGAQREQNGEEGIHVWQIAFALDGKDDDVAHAT